jgi:hypothetical protein
MSLRVDHKLSQLTPSRDSGKDLAALIVHINHVKHYLAGLFLVGQLCDQRQVVWVHYRIILDRRVVGLRILSLVVTTVEKASNFARGLS